MIDQLKAQLKAVKESLDAADFRKGNAAYIQGNCQILSQSDVFFEVLIEHEDAEEVVRITYENDQFYYFHEKKPAKWDASAVAALMQILEEYERLMPHPISEGRAYTREGMVKRVMDERRDKAARADYKITFADNVHGEHLLVNELGVKYKITLRDFENETGYIDNPDLKTNKLGTTKHIMYAFAKLKDDKKKMAAMDTKYPFVEIFLDPLNDYHISWHYPHELAEKPATLIKKFFGEEKFISDEEDVKGFLNFITAAREIPQIKVRREVDEKVRRAWDEDMLKLVSEKEKLDFSGFNATLFPYQKEGVRFATFRSGAIIADEMGLGKTIQAICTAVFKKQLFGFKRTLVICPASVKEQWKKEIEKFSSQEAVVVNGTPEERREIYRETSAYFIIINYETVLRDLNAINRMAPDFVVLDEAQRIKNFNTITARHIKKIKRKHALVITGTPIENKLIDIFSVVEFVEPGFLAPLWEFSYQHCYFDVQTLTKINGYFNLQELHERLSPILIRREKRKVLEELPQITEIDVPVAFHPDQQAIHASNAQGVASILAKKFITPYDQNRLMLLLNNMRMVCDSTYLVDKETYISPKLEELKMILLDKLSAKEEPVKIIIFSEWVTMLGLISKMLREEGLGHVMLSGKVSVKNRGKLVEKFENDRECKVFLSSEAGGTGLNLQVADTVINFELPWNPAKKNQRIGRIDRLGQRSKNLCVINLITRNSFELRIASGLSLKQNLFDGVLNEGTNLDYVDFSAAGRSQFLQQIEEAINGYTDSQYVELEEELEQNSGIAPGMETEDFAIIGDLVEESGAHPSEISENLSAKNTGESQEEMIRMEKVMNQGLEFLSGMFKMATGKDMGLEGQKFEMDKDTGEVVMRFKMGGFEG